GGEWRRGLAEQLIELGHVTGEVCGDDDACAGTRDAMTFGDHGGRIVKVVDAEVRGDEIEGLVGERHRGGIGFDEIDVREAVHLDLAPRTIERLAPEIESGEVRRRTVHERELEERKARAARDVEAADAAAQLEVVEDHRAKTRAPETQPVADEVGEDGVEFRG